MDPRALISMIMCKEVNTLLSGNSKFEFICFSKGLMEFVNGNNEGFVPPNEHDALFVSMYV